MTLAHLYPKGVHEGIAELGSVNSLVAIGIRPLEFLEIVGQEVFDLDEGRNSKNK